MKCLREIPSMTNNTWRVKGFFVFICALMPSRLRDSEEISLLKILCNCVNLGCSGDRNKSSITVIRTK